MNTGASEPIRLNDFKRQWAATADETMAAVVRVGASGWYILGAEVEAFERELARYWGLNEAIGCANGLDAIELSLRALGLKSGDKVLTTPLSAFATTLAILRAGGVPVFVDVDATGAMDLQKARTALEKDPTIRFCVPVHLYGHCMDLEALAALKAKFKLRVVEDCAQSIGARSGGKVCGSVGEFTATSFYPTKNLGALGDGGAVLTNLSAEAAEVRVLRDYGQREKYVHSEIGSNSRLDELHAAILRDAFLPTLKKHTARRAEIAGKYRAGIRNSRLKIVVPTDTSESVWHLFPVLVEGDRAAFQKHLQTRNIASAIHYPKLITDQPAYLKAVAMSAHPERYPVADQFAQSELSLPIHPFLTDAEATLVIDACNDWKG